MEDTTPFVYSEGAQSDLSELQERRASAAQTSVQAQALRRSRREFLTDAAVLGVGLAVGTSACSEASGDSAPLAAQSPAQSGSSPAPVPSEMPITLQINGKAYPMTVEPRVTLLDALRERARLTGTKKGCDHGQCGACTVLVEGRRVVSCLTLAVMHQGQPITTIEGLANGETLHPMQSAFLEHDGFQCGFCTSGQILSAVGLMQEGHAHSEAEIKEAMSGNICRCGAYPNIVTAIREVLEGKRNASL